MRPIAVLLSLLATACGARFDLSLPVSTLVLELQPGEPPEHRWLTAHARESLAGALLQLGARSGPSGSNPTIVVRAGTPQECPPERQAVVLASDRDTIVVCPPVARSVWTAAVVVRHELGHVLGANHTANPRSVMWPSVDLSRAEWASGLFDEPYTSSDLAEICSHADRVVGGACGQ